MLVGDPRKVLYMRAVVPVIRKVLRARRKVIALTVSENLLGILLCLRFFHLCLPLAYQLIVVAVVFFDKQIIISCSKVSTS